MSEVEVKLDAPKVGRPRSSSTVKVVCRLPHGLIINHPKTGDAVTLRGANSDRSMNIITPIFHAAMFGITEVDAEFMNDWLAVNKEFPAVLNKSIFIAKDESYAYEQVKDLADDKTAKTGFEGLPQETKDIKKAEF